jgi:hypothetical protein
MLHACYGNIKISNTVSVLRSDKTDTEYHSKRSNMISTKKNPMPLTKITVSGKFRWSHAGRSIGAGL